MKNNILFTAIFFFLSLSLLTAQAPSAFNYQGVARQNGDIITESTWLSHNYNQANLSSALNFQIESFSPEADAAYRFFRSTNTSGQKQVNFHRGNGENQTSARIGVDGENSFFQNHGGNLGVGTSEPEERLHINGKLKIQSESSPHQAILFSGGNGENLGDIKFLFSNNSQQIDFNITTTDVDKAALFRFFRTTNTSGAKLVNFYRGNGENQISASIGVDGANSFFQNHGGNVGIGTTTPSAKLHVNGTTKTKILEVTGADIIEKAHSKEELQPGEVIVIDPSNPNHVKRSEKAYDRTVVGVVSGAGGISHGIELAQAGVLDGDIPFAIAGRLPVKVTGKVKPGDLLTTSNVPGHAMVAKSRRKRDGAVIGKALGYPDENGLVLMLVMNK